MTAPYRADTPELLRATHEQIVRARAVTSSGVVDLVVDETAGATLSYDETRAPRVVARLACVVPEQTVLDQLDPRAGARLQLDVGYRWPGSGAEDVHQLVDLGLRDRVVDRPSNRMTVEAHSDEALVIDEAHAATSEVSASSADGVAYAAENLLRYALRNNAPSPVIENRYPATDASYSNAQLGDDPWRALVTLLDLIDGQLYDDGLRRWVIEPRPVRVTQSRAVLRVGPGGTITGSSTALSRADTGAAGWYNAVWLVFRHRSSSGTETVRVGSASVTSGALRTSGPAGVRRLVEEREQLVDQADATNAAAALLARTSSRGRRFDVDGVAAYWLRPGDTVTVQLPTGSQERHLVSSCEFDLIDGRMRLQTRLPDNNVSTTGG